MDVKLPTKKKPHRKSMHIRWNIEKTDEKFFDDAKVDFHFYISAINPNFYLNKINEQFMKPPFKSAIEIMREPKGRVHKSVNKYILITYRMPRKQGTFDWSEINIPVIHDSQLSDKKSKGNIEEYVSNLYLD